MYIPGCISRGADWAVANDHDVMFTTEVQKLGLCKIWMALNLLVKGNDVKRAQNALTFQYRIGWEMERICLTIITSKSNVLY